MTPILAAPPDFAPLTPRVRCPAGAVDCHVHLFGPRARFPFASGTRYVSEDRLPETQIALQERLGLARAVLVSGGAYGTDTRHLEHVLASHGDRFVGVALLDEAATPADVRRLDRLGVRAVRFVSPRHGGALPPLSGRTARLAADAGWHVHYYPHGTEIAAIGQHLLELPTPVVLDHFGHIPAAGGLAQPAFQTLLRLLDSGRIWVKLSGPMRITEEESPYNSVVPLARALVAHRPDRLLWGSDWPHVNMNGRTIPNDAHLLDLLAAWAPKPAMRDAILGDNPRRLFGL